MIRRFCVGTGDFVRLEETEEGVLMKPAKLIDRTLPLWLLPATTGLRVSCC